MVSRAISGTNIGKEITGILEGYGLPVLQSRIHQRVNYPPGTAAGGSTILEDFPGSEGAKEINQLMQELISLVSK